MKIFFRILALPFVIGLIFIGSVYWATRLVYAFMRYGGEFMIYKELNPATVEGLLLKHLKQKNN